MDAARDIQLSGRPEDHLLIGPRVVLVDFSPNDHGLRRRLWRATPSAPLTCGSRICWWWRGRRDKTWLHFRVRQIDPSVLRILRVNGDVEKPSVLLNVRFGRSLDRFG